MRQRALIALLFFAMLWIETAAAGNTYYVDVQGIGGTCSDSSSSPGTISEPFCSIQKAVDIVGPGDTVLIRGGTYNGRVDFNKGGTEGNYIVFKPYNNEEVVIQDAKTFSGWR
ncbi:MAG: hypothetical protein Q8N60_05700, partial [Candidatus Diapherotrites archaeon]|nr:hypothetical protein [Candidatus Diapherotrites archaeon]